MKIQKRKMWGKGIILSAFILFSTVCFSFGVEVPVRVFEKNKFIDTLTAADFEVYDNGQPCTIDSLYLVNKTEIKTQNSETTGKTPNTSRQFCFLFKVLDYDSKLGDVIDYFFKEVYLPGDSLMIVTPVKVCNFEQNVLQQPKEKLAETIKNVLKNDITAGNVNYKGLFETMKTAVINIAVPLDASDNANSSGGFGGGQVSVNTLKNDLANYRQALAEFNKIRMLNSEELVKLGKFFKQENGLKTYCAIFYQNEFRPIPDRDMMDRLRKNAQIKFDAMEVFTGEPTAQPFNLDIVKETFADSNVICHLVYLKKEPQRQRFLEMKDNSGDVYSAFSDLAKFTGGTNNTTAKPVAGLENIKKEVDSYYFLYLKPVVDNKDGTFHRIEIKLKDKKNYRLAYRPGYYAR